MEPAKAPPMALLYASSFCLRLAEASLVNMYAPPMAAAEVSSQSFLSNCHTSFPSSFSVFSRGHTENANGASCAGEDTECADILLSKGILNGRDEGACTTGDEGGLDGGAHGVLGVVVFGPLIQFGHGCGVWGVERVRGWK